MTIAGLFSQPLCNFTYYKCGIQSNDQYLKLSYGTHHILLHKR